MFCESVAIFASGFAGEMGYGAKAIMLQSVRWTMLMIFADALRAQGVVISGKTSPGMRTYDIWGAAPKNEPMNESEQNQVTSSDDVLLHDYSQKSSLRHGKGSLHSRCFALWCRLAHAKIVCNFENVKLNLNFVRQFSISFPC